MKMTELMLAGPAACDELTPEMVQQAIMQDMVESQTGFVPPELSASGGDGAEEAPEDDEPIDMAVMRDARLTRTKK